MYRYKLVQKINPKDKDAAKKWYAIPIGDKPQDVKAMTRAATANTSTAPIEMEASFSLLGSYAKEQLLQGHIVKVGELGTLRVTFKSKGVVDITEFNPGTMIVEPRILFTPSKVFREELINELKFRNAGVLAEGVSYATLSDYKLAKGITTGGNGGGNTPGDGGDQNENPLG